MTAWVQLLAANHVFFVLNLCAYILLGSTFIWTLVQYLRLRGQGAARDASLLSAPVPPDAALPVVLIQVPTFNEGALIGRIATALAGLDWPRDRLKVQILDDSTDGSEVEGEKAAQILHERGIEVALPRRSVRRGFKAGALAEGLRQSSAPFVAVFDADYVPDPGFLKACMRPLIADDRLAFVQARCDYLNGDENGLTRAQQRILDAHYAIEQPARCWSGQIVPFNGTCGVWRRAAIEAVGGWQGDTLAEDMDLSFRVQLNGWTALFLSDVAAPGELPNSFETWRRQQFRWTKGSAEVTRKLFASVWCSKIGFGRKVVATLQLGGGLFGLMFGLTVVSGLIDLILGRGLTMASGLLLAVLLAEVLGGPMLLQLAGQTLVRRRRLSAELLQLPLTMAFQLSVSLVNLAAGFEALMGRTSPFERTPKEGGALGLIR
jgi:cellulose synthase/poly-beta-1,6-N-acetylglucosamine synthase-like glycosyltransferase